MANKATTATLTTWYLPGFEKETNSATSSVEYKYYLSAGGRSLGVFVDHATVAAPMTPTTWASSTLVNGVSTATPLAAGADWRYFHQDPLGSVVAITNASGAVMEQLSYDAFGKRRNADGSDAAIVAASPYGLLPPVNGEDRGYTGHEMLDSIGLVHMNGRVYDPTTGRFLSADPFIQAPGFTLSYNRYAYVVNNPLVLTDPSGFRWFDDLTHHFNVSLSLALGDFGSAYLFHRYENAARANPYFRMVAAGIAAYYTAGLASAWMEAGAVAVEGETAFAVATTDTAGGLASVSLTPLGGAVAGASGGFVGGLAYSGGDLRTAAQGALSGGTFGFVGAAFSAGSFGNYAGHAVAGCIDGAVGGGGCGRGAASAVVGKFITVQTNGGFIGTVVAGGTASVITGGKFINGAKTAAFGYILNRCLTASDCWKETLEQLGQVVKSVIPSFGPTQAGSSLGFTAVIGMGVALDVGPVKSTDGSCAIMRNLCVVAGPMAAATIDTTVINLSQGSPSDGWTVSLINKYAIPVGGYSVSGAYGSDGLAVQLGRSFGTAYGSAVKGCVQQKVGSCSGP